MNKRASILLSIGILATVAVVALATGRPSVPLFDPLPAGVASGLVAYENGACVSVVDLTTTSVIEIRCSDEDRSEFEFYFTEDALLQIAAFGSSEADLVDPRSGEIVGQVDTGDPRDLRSPDRQYPGWATDDHQQGMLLEVGGQEYILPGTPSAYDLRNASVSDSGDWVVFADNLDELVLVGVGGGPWVVEIGIDDHGRLEWAPGS